MKSVKIAPAALMLFSFLIPTLTARTDIEQPPAPALGGLRLLPDQSTEVQMAYERVEITLNPFRPEDNGWMEPIFDVTALFVMHNTGTNDEEVKAAFPLDSLARCGVYYAPPSHGTNSSNILLESFKIAGDGSELQTEIIYVDGGIDCVRWAAFDLEVPAQKDVLVKVDYSMRTTGIGRSLILEYMLETGAGWKGPIKQADVIFRFPYLVTSGNINSAQTTPGYRSRYNEISWSYQNLEPTRNDNVVVTFFEPYAWKKIQALEDQVAKTPTDADAWLKLFEEYLNGKPYDVKEVSPLYERAIKFNPDHADLYAQYAFFLFAYRCYPKQEDGTLPADCREIAEQRVIPLVDRSLALDSHNETALYVVELVQITFPDVTYTPPPTVLPAHPGRFTATASITPTPSETPVIPTAVPTETVPPSTSTATSTPMPTSSPPEVPAQDLNGTSIPLLIFGALGVFMVGIGIGTFWQKRKGK